MWMLRRQRMRLSPLGTEQAKRPALCTPQHRPQERVDRLVNPASENLRTSGHRSYSITSFARASTDGGTVRPSAFAVFRLIVRSYLVGACTGRSAGFAAFERDPIPYR